MEKSTPHRHVQAIVTGGDDGVEMNTGVDVDMGMTALLLPRRADTTEIEVCQLQVDGAVLFTADDPVQGDILKQQAEVNQQKNKGGHISPVFIAPPVYHHWFLVKKESARITCSGGQVKCSANVNIFQEK